MHRGLLVRKVFTRYYPNQGEIESEPSAIQPPQFVWQGFISGSDRRGGKTAHGLDRAPAQSQYGKALLYEDANSFLLRETSHTPGRHARPFMVNNPSIYDNKGVTVASCFEGME